MRLSYLLPAIGALTLPLKATDVVYDAFESDGYGEWKIEGSAFGKSPSAASPEGLNGKVEGYSDGYYVSSAHGGDAATGSLTSQEFEIKLPYIGFLISGGNHAGKTSFELVIDGQAVESAVGNNDLTMRQVVWSVKDHIGKKATLRLVDSETGGWGIINLDHIVFSDQEKPHFPAQKKIAVPDADGLVASDVIPGMTIPQGAIATLFADNEKHDVYSPTALTVDEKGNVFVAETHRFRFGVEDNRNHLYWLMDDMSAQTTDDRVKMHEKWQEKLPLEKMTKISEKIRVLVDTNGDGVADESKVFAEEFNDLLDGTAAGVMAFEGKIYFACIPKIWMLRDTNGDLISDERTSLQDGFGVRVSFSGHDLNGFALGPDGRIYTTIGDRGFNITTAEGKQYQYPGQGAILRFEPDGSNFEVVHTGLRNPKEIAFDQFGTGVSVDNNSDQGDRARVVIMTEGADSGWRMGHQVLHSFHKTAGIPERPINQWMQEKMWEPLNDAQPGHILPPIANFTSGPSGLAYYPGTGFDLNCEDRFLICDYRGGAAASGISYFSIKDDGAGYAFDESGKFNWGVAVTDVEWGYDGKLYISDFVTGWQSHKAGRIYTLGENKPDTSIQKLIAETNFAELNESELAGYLSHADQRIRLRAQLHLADKPGALAHFTASANQQLNRVERLHGIWGLGMIARKQKSPVATNFLLQLLGSDDPEVRAHVAKVLGEATLESAEPLAAALTDGSPRVRANAAISIGRVGDTNVLPAVIEMIASNGDENPTLRHAGVMALLGTANAQDLAGLNRHESAAVRRAAVIALRRLGSDQVANFLGDDNLAIADDAVRAIHDNYIEKARPAVAALLDDLTTEHGERPLTRMMLRRLVHSAFRLGDENNLVRVINVAGNNKLPIEERLEAMRLLENWAKPHVVDQSNGKHSPLPERDSAMIKRVLTQNLSVLLDGGAKIFPEAMKMALQYQVRHEGLDSGSLTRIVRDEKADGKTRAAALNLLVQTAPENLDELLSEAANASDDKLASTALELASERDPASNLAALKGALQSKSVDRRQKAWKIISELPAEHAVPVIRDGLVALKSGDDQPGDDLDLLMAARSREEPAIKSALEEYQKSLAKDDPLAKFAPTLSGGNAGNGGKIFKSHGAAQCMRCHQDQSGHNEGGTAGPILEGVALRLDAKGLLESLVAPQATIADGFGIATLELKDGTSKGGIIVGQNEKTIDLKEGETVWRVKRSDLKTQPKPASAMPPIVGILSESEIRDVIAYLLTLTKKGDQKVAPYEAKELTLVTTETKETGAMKEPEKTDAAAAAIDPAVMEMGKQQFVLCAACHGPDGKGVPNIGPPLANSEWVNGPGENLIKIQMRGLTGPITVDGKEYNFPAPMAPLGAAQSDEQMASVLTYIRNSFGNKAPQITPEMVTPHRGEAGKPMLTVADLVDPHGKEKPAETADPKEAATTETEGAKPEMTETKETTTPTKPTEGSDTSTAVSESSSAVDPAVMKLGEAQYAVCAACHGPSGAGVANVGPPLANSEWVQGPVENLIRIQMRGLEGPISVAGKEYNFQAPMAPLGAIQNDEQMAAVLTYIRNSFGNEASMVTPEMITPLRSELGKPMLTVKDLVTPTVAGSDEIPVLAEVPSGGLGAPLLGTLAFLVTLVLSVLVALRMKAVNN